MARKSAANDPEAFEFTVISAADMPTRVRNGRAHSAAYKRLTEVLPSLYEAGNALQINSTGERAHADISLARRAASDLGMGLRVDITTNDGRVLSANTADQDAVKAEASVVLHMEPREKRTRTARVEGE